MTTNTEHAPLLEAAEPQRGAAAHGAGADPVAPQHAVPVSATAGVVQVGAADDAAEHAADAAAENVVRRLHPPAEPPGAGDDDPRAGHGSQGSGRPVRRASANGPGVIGAAGGRVGGPDAERLSALRGAGTPLSGDIRARFGTALGADLSGVRVHTGADASALNERFSARAFTLGKDVYFRDGAPDLGTEDGTRLMAHELAHTVQPDRSAAHRLLEGGTIRRDDTIAAPTTTGSKAPPKKKGGFFSDPFGIKKRKEEKEQKRLKDEADEADRKREEARQEKERADLERKRKEQEALDKRTKSYDEIGTLKLTELEKYAAETADWDKNSTVATKSRAARISQLLAFAGIAASGACGFAVADILALGTSSEKMTKAIEQLTAYGKAVQNDPFPIKQAATAAEAAKIGTALGTLLGAFPAWVLTAAMTEDTFNGLRQNNLINDVIAYYQGGVNKPIFQAENGMDFISYLQMRLDDGVDPRTYQGGDLKDYVRNFHRFEKRLLDRLIVNLKDTNADKGKRKPLTLILHTSVDHNGAFHRDPEMFRVVDQPTNNTIMVEGGDTLDDYKSRITPLATAYGANNKIDQVMFAGHGNAQLIEIAGGVTQGVTGRLEQTGENLDVATGSSDKAKTEELFDEVLANMDELSNLTDPKQPHRKILFNACLTNSNQVGDVLSGRDEAKARTLIRRWIRNNMSLATYLNDKATKKGSQVSALGANASITQVELIDSTGGLDLVTSADPKVTASKIEYAEHGTEPTGVLRAALEAFGFDRPAAVAAMQARVNRTTTGSSFTDLLIWSMFTIIVDRASGKVSGGVLNDFRRYAELAEPLDHLKSETAASLAGLRVWLKAGWCERVLKTLIDHSPEGALPKQGLMLRTAYLATKPAELARRQAVLDCLSGPAAGWTVKTARTDAHAGRYLDIQLLDEIGVLPAMLAGAPSRGKLILALAGLLSDQKPAACGDYLRAQRKPLVAKVDGLPEVPAVPEVKAQPAPRDLVPEVPAVPGRPKVAAIPGQRKEYAAVPDLEKLDALPAVAAPPKPKGKAKPVVVTAPGRNGRAVRKAVDAVPAVAPYFEETLKVEELLGGASTVALVLKAL